MSNEDEWRVIWSGRADGLYGGGISFAVVGDHENRPTDMTNLVVIKKDGDKNIDGKAVLQMGRG